MNVSVNFTLLGLMGVTGRGTGSLTRIHGGFRYEGGRGRLEAAAGQAMRRTTQEHQKIRLISEIGRGNELEVGEFPEVGGGKGNLLTGYFPKTS
jgi:hypothetical protein